MKLYVPVVLYPHAGLISAVADGERSGSSFSRFIPRTESVFYIFWESLKGKTAGWSAVEKRNISYPCWESKHDSFVFQSIA